MPGKLFRIITTSRSRRNLDQITEYQRQNSSAANARKVRNGILRSASKLKRMPQSKPILPGTEGYDPEIRYTKAWSYKIIFSVFTKAREVVLLMIRHDKEDPEEILKDL